MAQPGSLGEWLIHKQAQPSGQSGSQQSTAAHPDIASLFQAEDLPSQPSDKSFHPLSQVESQESQSTDNADAETYDDLTPKDLVSLQALSDPSYAQTILNRQRVLRQDGWCRLVNLEKTKVDGYVQVSYGGANKFAMLQEVVLWSSGGFRREDENGRQQCSHLCHQPLCSTLGHVIAESPQENNARKNCLVWLDCHHCQKKIFVCPHALSCIKFCEGFDSMDDMLAKGAFCNR